MNQPAHARPRVGWIGTGRMGRPMLGRVREAGWPLCLWARRAGALEGLAAVEAMPGPQGLAVEPAESPAALAQRCDIVCTMVSGPEDVEALQAQLMPAARPGTLFIDFSTAAPRSAWHAARLAQVHGHASLEAPVTGGVAGAQRGSLTCFVGGEAAALARATPLLQALTQRIVPCGGVGDGYRTKLVNQTLVAGLLMGLADGARLARASLPRQADGAAPPWQQALGSGTAGSMLFESYFDRMLHGTGPVSFSLGLLGKDLRLARAEADALGLATPLLEAALAAVQAAIGRHGAEAGVQALAL